MYCVNGKYFADLYRNKLSGYAQWCESELGCGFYFNAANIGPYMSLDETCLSNGEVWTFLTNKDGHGGRGTLAVSIRNKPTFWGAKFWRTLLPKSFAMFNLNENNRFVMAQQPSDMRAGVNKLCGEVRSVGLDPTNGDVYVFVGSSRKLMKLLHWERGGYVMYYKRLEQGRFHPKIFLRQGIGFRSMRWDELVLLMEGISPRVARRRRYQTEVIEQEKDGKITEKSLRKVWLSR